MSIRKGIIILIIFFGVPALAVAIFDHLFFDVVSDYDDGTYEYLMDKTEEYFDIDISEADKLDFVDTKGGPFGEGEAFLSLSVQDMDINTEKLMPMPLEEDIVTNVGLVFDCNEEIDTEPFKAKEGYFGIYDREQEKVLDHDELIASCSDDEELHRYTCVIYLPKEEDFYVYVWN